MASYPLEAELFLDPEEQLAARSRRAVDRTGAPSSGSARWSCAFVGLLLAIVVFVFVQAWPSFAHNGLAWFGAGGNVDEQFRDLRPLGPGAAPTTSTRSTPGR